MALFHKNNRIPDLKVRWRSGLVTNFELQSSSMPQRGYVGVRANHDLKALESHDEVEVLPYRKEYVMALVEGHLWAVDEDTARCAAAYAGKPTDWKRFMQPEEPKAEPEVKPGLVTLAHPEIVDSHDEH